MKIQMTAKAMDDNGNEATRTIGKEAAIPDIAEYGEPEDFREIFHRMASFFLPRLNSYDLLAFYSMTE